MAELKCAIAKFWFFFLSYSLLKLYCKVFFRFSKSSDAKLQLPWHRKYSLRECFWGGIDATWSFNKVLWSILKTVNIFCFFFFFFVLFSFYRRLNNKKTFFFLLVKLNLLSFFNFVFLRESWLLFKAFEMLGKKEEKPFGTKKTLSFARVGLKLRKLGKLSYFSEHVSVKGFQIQQSEFPWSLLSLPEKWTLSLSIIDMIWF